MALIGIGIDIDIGIGCLVHIVTGKCELERICLKESQDQTDEQQLLIQDNVVFTLSIGLFDCWLIG